MQIITPYHIYFNARLILQKWELWRLITNFCYFGNLSEPLPCQLAVALIICLSAPGCRSGLCVSHVFHDQVQQLPGGGLLPQL